MADNNETNKRYYWIKLKDSFLTSDKVDFLMSQTDGAKYVVLYQMLCLKTLNTNGVLARTIGEMIIPFDEEKIQRDCKYFSIDTIKVAFVLYQKLGMIYTQENGTLRITDFDNMIGSETEWAEKKRLYREKKKEIGHQEDNVLQLSETMSETESDKRIDIRDKILEIREKDKNNKKEKINKNKNKQVFGAMENVLLSEEELEKLKTTFPYDYLKRIDDLSYYIASNGKKYSSHYSTILSWSRKETKTNSHYVPKNKSTNLDNVKEEDLIFINEF